jgi:hypothetical protein
MGTLDTLTNGLYTKSITYSPTAAGDQATPIVAAIAGKKIRVYAIVVSISIGGSNCYVRNGAGGTQLTETYFRTLSGSAFPSYYSRCGYQGIWLYESLVGVSLVLNCTTAGGVVSISLVYSYV